MGEGGKRRNRGAQETGRVVCRRRHENRRNVWKETRETLSQGATMQKSVINQIQIKECGS